MNFTFHTHSESGASCPQPSMDVPLAHYIVTSGGTTFGLLETNTRIPITLGIRWLQFSAAGI